MEHTAGRLSPNAESQSHATGFAEPGYSAMRRSESALYLRVLRPAAVAMVLDGPSRSRMVLMSNPAKGAPPGEVVAQDPTVPPDGYRAFLLTVTRLTAAVIGLVVPLQ